MKRAQHDLSKDVRITAEDACKVAPRQTVLLLRNLVFSTTGLNGKVYGPVQMIWHFTQVKAVLQGDARLFELRGLVKLANISVIRSL
jgi:hypothetical protein